MKSGFYKKGKILTENIIFIVLNLIFVTILIVFLVGRIGSNSVLEEKYAKQIAMIIDSAKPVTRIDLNMEDALNKKEEGWDAKNMVTIKGNIVTVKLGEKGDYSYSFFNNVDVDAYPKGNDKEYIIIINEK